MILVVLTIVLGTVVVLQLVALAGRRAWVQRKLGPRQKLVEEAFETLAGALVLGTAVARPVGWARRRAFRLAALELFSALSGDSRARLARLLDEAGVVDQALRELRRSPNAFVRRQAADELGELRSRRAVSAFEAGLEDRDPVVRLACARGLLHIPELGRLERIVEILDRDVLAEQVEAAAALLALAQAAPDALVRFLGSARSPTARWYAALVLARFKRVEALPALRAALTMPNAFMVSAAVHGIAVIGGAEASSLLEGVAADADRDAAIRELAGRELARVQVTGGVA